ncbi:MAG: membrane dipeptidase [Anaerolineales bacterium]|nr:membrane dipeptidase [Anaerolineales bacterium]
MLIVDAHLDLAYTALEFGRDLRRPLSELREAERKNPTSNGIPTVSVPELQRGGVNLVFGTLFLEPVSTKAALAATKMNYLTAVEAHQKAHQQLDYYHRLADELENVVLVGDTAVLNDLLASQQNSDENATPQLGIVPLMEGADPIRDPAELEEWWARGLRIIGPAWDDTRYASGAWRGTREGFTSDGFLLMEVMADLGFILDLTHLSEQATQEALERYDGTVIATHSNCRALVDHVGQRNLSDTHIRLLGERGGVMGIVLYNRFLKQGHLKGERRDLVTLDHVVAHIDHVCQLLGSSEHVGIGSDFDGGFGWADIPAELNSVADLHLIGDKLKERGYTAVDTNNILGGNWVRRLQTSWGDT